MRGSWLGNKIFNRLLTTSRTTMSAAEEYRLKVPLIYRLKRHQRMANESKEIKNVLLFRSSTPCSSVQRKSNELYSIWRHSITSSVHQVQFFWVFSSSSSSSGEIKAVRNWLLFVCLPALPLPPRLSLNFIYSIMIRIITRSAN